MNDKPSKRLLPDETAVLRSLVEGTASETGREFFRALVTNLAAAVDVHGAWVTEYLSEEQKLSALALWIGGEIVDNYTYHIKDTPCEPVIEHKSRVISTCTACSG